MKTNLTLIFIICLAYSLVLSCGCTSSDMSTPIPTGMPDASPTITIKIPITTSTTTTRIMQGSTGNVENIVLEAQNSIATAERSIGQTEQLITYFKVNKSMGSDARLMPIVARWEIAADKLSDAKDLQSAGKYAEAADKATEAAAKGNEVLNDALGLKEKVETTQSTVISSEPRGVQANVLYSGKWSGALVYGSNMKSIDGTGIKTFEIPNSGYSISITAQKEDGSTNALTVQILSDGKVIASEWTNAAYGVAATSITL